MKREVRRIHWYTAEKEKTNDTKVIKDQTYCIFIICASCQQIIRFRLAFKDKGHKSLEYSCQLFSNTFDIRRLTRPQSLALYDGNGLGF